ncbi:hypothetical protein AGDE_16318 [Angomonas deanei]|uniref:Uncharacterized protein n=1 Tax=Angomonas deanei TaxID=59799 RepID=A0A7G2CRT6_9TRYP|nr:hypothetical protein AGDE_16318 [Angomonas deanei]CAD2221694.1 hypothetical protein, conserved [Angomonas deanei]|eukprot:EPY17323.1 hypothetical protein AGDE_16318 [Angomonas deanei]
MSCVTCPDSNCVSCSADNTCDGCQGTYQLSKDHTSCQTFVSGCAEYDNTGCASCPDNKVLSVGIPIKCVSCNVDNCDKCSDDDVCYTCKEGYSTIGNGAACTKTIDNCFSYTDDGLCASCLGPLLGPYLEVSLDGKSCISCEVSGCDKCSSTDYCGQCDAGLTVSADGKTCAACAIKDCQSCENLDKCHACLNGFSATVDKTRCVTSVRNCAEHTLDGCNRCSTGFHKVNGECVPDSVEKKRDNGAPWWAWLILGLGLAVIVAVVVVVAVCLYRRRAAVAAAAAAPYAGAAKGKDKDEGNEPADDNSQSTPYGG